MARHAVRASSTTCTRSASGQIRANPCSECRTWSCNRRAASRRRASSSSTRSFAVRARRWARRVRSREAAIRSSASPKSKDSRMGCAVHTRSTANNQDGSQESSRSSPQKAVHIARAKVKYPRRSRLAMARASSGTPQYPTPHRVASAPALVSSIQARPAALATSSSQTREGRHRRRLSSVAQASWAPQRVTRPGIVAGWVRTRSTAIGMVVPSVVITKTARPRTRTARRVSSRAEVRRCGRGTGAAFCHGSAAMGWGTAHRNPCSRAPAVGGSVWPVHGPNTRRESDVPSSQGACPPLWGQTTAESESHLNSPWSQPAAVAACRREVQVWGPSRTGRAARSPDPPRSVPPAG